MFASPAFIFWANSRIQLLANSSGHSGQRRWLSNLVIIGIARVDGLRKIKRSMEVLKLISTKLFSTPDPKGLVAALVMTFAILLVSLFKSRKGTKKPSTVEAVLMAEKPSILVKLIEVIGAVAAAIAIVLSIILPSGNLSGRQWSFIFGIIIISGGLSGIILYWTVRLEK